MAGTFAWVLPIAGNLRRNHAVRPEARWHLLRKNYDLNFPRRGGWQGRSFFALIVPRILALHVNHFDNHSEKCLADLMMPWWSAVTVTPSRIGKSVTVTDCHSNSSFLRALKWPIFEQNPSTFDWYMTQNAKSTFYLALLECGCSKPWNNASLCDGLLFTLHFTPFYPIFTLYSVTVTDFLSL